MGIPRFFYWLYKEYPSVLTKIQQKERVIKYNIQVDTYALDLNAIVHPVCQQVFKYGQFKENDNNSIPRTKSFMHRNSNINKNQNSNISNEQKDKRIECFEKICEKIDELVDIVNPNSKIILALDGTAGMSKQYQQRQRRYRAIIDNPVLNTNIKKEFDSNEITTGSVFMNQLSLHINEYIKIKIKNDWKHLDVYFSSEQVQGEGEHKIMHMLKQYSSFSSYCIHSPDADLIMLSLASLCTTEYKKCYIMRDNIYQNVYCKYFIVDVNSFRDILIEKFKKYTIGSNTFKKLYLSDFIFYCFFFGNDFLPENPLMLTDKNGIDMLFMIYSDTLINKGSLTSIINNKVTLNIDECIYFFEQLSFNESVLFKKKYMSDNCKHKLQDINSYIKNKHEDVDNTEEFNYEADNREYNNNNSINIKEFKKQYYKNKFGFDVDNNDKYNKQIYKLCNEYVRGIQFVLSYYLYDIPDWYWYYPYHYAPFFSDIHYYLKSIKEKRTNTDNKYNNILSYKFEKNEPLTPYEQLLAVLPPESSDILPKPFSELMINESSELKTFYPDTNSVKIEIKNEYEKTILVPFINVKLLRDTFDKYYQNQQEYLTKEEKERNTFTKNINYINSSKQKL